MKKKQLIEYPWINRSQCLSYIENILRFPADYQIEVIGKMCSKKNNYCPSPNGKGFFKTKKITNAEDMVSLQIPGEYKDLKLENPHVMFQFKAPKKSWRSDRDNWKTFAIDCLVKNGVLADDAINHLNGVDIAMPVIESSEYKCLISIWRNE